MEEESQNGNGFSEEQKAKVRRTFNMMKGFAIAVQVIITIYWWLRGTPDVSLALPVLSVIVLAVGLIGFAAGFKSMFMAKMSPFLDLEDEQDSGDVEERATG